MDDRSADMAMLALQGPTALGLVELPELAPFGFTHVDVCGVPAIVARTGYTGEPGVELMVAGERAVDCGTRWSRRVPSRAAWARATRCGSRSVTRCTATTSRWSGPRSRLGWVGSARSTRRTSSAPKRCARSVKRAARPVGRLCYERAQHPQPGHADPAGRRRHQRHHVTFDGYRHRHGIRPGRRREAGHEIEIDVRGRALAATVESKPLYVKETST